jgi:hypothetical protein
MSLDVEVRLRALGEQLERGVAHVDVDEILGATTSIRGALDTVSVEVTLADSDPLTITPTRRHRWPIVAVAAAVVAVLVSALVLAIRHGPTERDPATPPTAPADVVAGRVGFVGLPPPGAIPSTPEVGELVVFVQGPEVGSRTWVYADGRLIWHRYADLPEGATPYFTGFLEQRLTPEGVELLRSETASLLDGDQLRPDRAERVPNLRQPCPWVDCRLLVRDGSSLVSVPWPGEDSPVLARINDLGSWLPASAWEDPEIKAYVPSRYSVCYDSEAPGFDRMPQLVQDLFSDAWRDPASPTFNCADLTTEEARSLVDAVDDAGLGRDNLGEPGYSLEYPIDIDGDFPFASNRLTLAFGFEPYLPHFEVYCQNCG